MLSGVCAQPGRLKGAIRHDCSVALQDGHQDTHESPQPTLRNIATSVRFKAPQWNRRLHHRCRIQISIYVLLSLPADPLTHPLGLTSPAIQGTRSGAVLCSARNSGLYAPRTLTIKFVWPRSVLPSHFSCFFSQQAPVVWFLRSGSTDLSAESSRYVSNYVLALRYSEPWTCKMSE